MTVTELAGEFSGLYVLNGNTISGKSFARSRKRLLRRIRLYEKAYDDMSAATDRISGAGIILRECTYGGSDGEAYILEAIKYLLRNIEGELREADIAGFIEALGEGVSDDELECLCDFIYIASFEILYERGESEDAYRRIAYYIRNINFNYLLEELSPTDRILSSEAAGLYRYCSKNTKTLYKTILKKNAEKNLTDITVEAEKAVAEANSENVHVGTVLLRKNKEDRASGIVYFIGIFLTVVLLSVVIPLSYGFGRSSLLFILLSVIPAYELGKQIMWRVLSGTGVSFLPRLIGKGAECNGCLVVITTLLFGEKEDRHIFDRLEEFYLTNKDGNYRFSVLGDLPEAQRKTVKSDAGTIAYAEARIKALNNKYGDKFMLFIRSRAYSASESEYFGWERKRGAVIELCRFCRGVKGSFSVFNGDRTFLKSAEYILTLDADTDIYIGAVRELVGIMNHPCNKPVIDRNKRVVTEGYGVIQPKLTTSLSSFSTSMFAQLTGGDGGIDIYAGAGFDLYQNVFNEGIFCGKGIIDIDAFLYVCADAFPENRILSHDLLEGGFLRAGLASDVVFTDSTPKNAVSYYKRQERWLRGDMQALPYIGKNIRRHNGSTVKNPFTKLTKYKITDNILRAAFPLMSILLISASFAFSRSFMTAALFLAVMPCFFPFICELAEILFRKELRTAGRRFASVVLPKPISTLLMSLYKLAALPYEAFIFAVTAVRVTYTFTVSKKGYMKWTTAAEGDKFKNGNRVSSYFRKMAFSVIYGAVASYFFYPFASFISFLWILFPFIAYELSRPRPEQDEDGTGNRVLRSYAGDMWAYFSENVSQRTNHLPPDNIQYSPVERVAERTSPTNIGLYLMSMLAARDFGFISSEKLAELSSNTVRSLSSMLTWNGHFYNWYETKELSVIGEHFISSVDSGNFVCMAISFCEGIKEYSYECVRLLDVCSALAKLVSAADFSKLYDSRARLFFVGYNVGTGKYSDSHYDVLMSESRLLSYYAVASLQVPREHYFALSRSLISKGSEIGAASWSGTAFEYFMPSLLLPVPENSITDETLSYAYKRELEAAVSRTVRGKKRVIYGISESGYFKFDYEMNYQYKAFGIHPLALDTDVYDSDVVSPYSSFLMLSRSKAQILHNLSEEKKLGMYGKYGFYEAIDLDSTRVGGGYAIIKSFMAHHVGMSIAAAANSVYNGIFIKRFMRNPAMRASYELLEEKIPVSAKCAKRRKSAKKPEKPEPVFETGGMSSVVYNHNLLFPEVGGASNNKCRITASSSGHVVLYNGEELVSAPHDGKYSLGCGLRVTAHIDGHVISAVPLGYTGDGIESRFGFSSSPSEIVYRSEHICMGSEYTFDVRLSVLPDRDQFEIRCDIGGTFGEAFAVLYFEPLLDTKENYLSHKPFSGLFVESEYSRDDKVLVFIRRPRSDLKKKEYLGVAAFSGAELTDPSFETKRNRLLPYIADERDISSAVPSGHGEDGACVVPACCIKTGTINDGRQELGFIIGYNTDRDDLIYNIEYALTKSARKSTASGIKDLALLQKRASGMPDDMLFLENAVLRGLVFGSSGNIPYNTDALKVMPYSKERLWARSVSGDNPMAGIEIGDMSEEEERRLVLYFSLFRYMKIRGFTFDLLVFYYENDGYNSPVKKAIQRAAVRARTEGCLNCRLGIFPINLSYSDKREEAALKGLCFSVYKLSSAPDVAFNTNKYYIPVSAEDERKLKTEPFKKNGVTGKEDGHFENNKYVIENKNREFPWAHIIASVTFGTVVTDSSAGYTYFSNSALYKLTRHSADAQREDDGERIILRMRRKYSEEKDYDLCAYSDNVVFGDGYAEYSGNIEDTVSYKVRITVASKASVKNADIRLENRGEGEILLSVYFIAGFCLGDRYRYPGMYSCEYDTASNAVKVYSLISDRTRRLGLILSSDKKLSGAVFDEATFRTDNRIFIKAGDIACVYRDISLSDTDEFSFFIGGFSSEEHYGYIVSRYIPSYKPSAVPRVTRPAVRIKTGTLMFDETVNFWYFYQTLCSRLYARSGFYQTGGAYGFRDQLQDTMSVLCSDPYMAKLQILRAAAHQYEEGDVMHWWHPTDFSGRGNAGIRTRFRDDPLWLVLTVSEYIRTTGDKGILDINVRFLRSPVLDKNENERYETTTKTREKYNITEHCRRAVEYSVRTGAHGLLLFGGGDWNDGMNAVGIKGTGESVWLTQFALYVITLGIRSGVLENGPELENTLSGLKRAVEECSFNGEWYIRGFYDNGAVLGTKGSDECEIDMMPQAWAEITEDTVGGVFDRHRIKKALRAAYTKLYSKKDRCFSLLYPPFDRGSQKPGYIKGYAPGVRENGGQYTHAAIWMAKALLLSGENEKGAELIYSLNSAVRQTGHISSEAYKKEPYVLAGDILTEKSVFGMGGWSWYTGASGWYRKTVLENLAGFDMNGTYFTLSPRLSGAFGPFSLEVDIGYSHYTINVTPSVKTRIIIDGTEAVLPSEKDGKYRFPLDSRAHTVDFFAEL